MGTKHFPKSFIAIRGAAVLALALLAFGLAQPAAASVIDYNLNADGCSSGCGLSSYGTVEISDISGGGVHVVARLAPNILFLNTGALDNALAFSLNGDPNITIDNLSTPDFSVGDSTGGTPNISGGGTFGSFAYGIACTGCGKGIDGRAGPISFDIATAGITTASFIDGIKTTGPTAVGTGYYFVADIGNTLTGATGRVAATLDPPPATEVPEPATLFIFGAALLAFVFLSRRRRAQELTQLCLGE